MFRSRLWALCLVLAIVLAGIMGTVFQHQPLVHAASTLTVTTTADTTPPCKASAFSLRCAIDRANTDGSGDNIVFNIPATTCGLPPCTIGLSQSLPVLTASHTTINGNLIFANGGGGFGGLGIDLLPEGVVNCTTSPPGPNDYLPCPIINSATTTKISGTACASCLVEVYIATNEADDQGHGEGKTFLGRVTANGSGNWSLALSAGQVSAGQNVTATSTTTSSPLETSEFGANVVVTT